MKSLFEKLHDKFIVDGGQCWLAIDYKDLIFIFKFLSF